MSGEKPAPTAAEVAAARYWFSGADPLREPSMGPTTRVHVAVLLAALDAAEAEKVTLRAFIADSLPFLREAWTACFHGEERRMLSAEERGMGRLLASFQSIADGKPARAPGWVTMEECAERVENATKWAHDLLGDPNEPHPAMKRWCSPGLTAAHALKEAHAEVERLEAKLDGAIVVADGPETRERLARVIYGEYEGQCTRAGFTALPMDEMRNKIDPLTGYILAALRESRP